MEETKTIGVFNPGIARALFAKGHKLVDFKPNRTDRHRTVFYFVATDAFIADFEAEKADAALHHDQMAQHGIETAIKD